jgi:hypothetical protein
MTTSKTVKNQKQVEKQVEKVETNDKKKVSPKEEKQAEKVETNDKKKVSPKEEKQEKEVASKNKKETSTKKSSEPNKATALSGLELNVRAYRGWMTKQLSVLSEILPTGHPQPRIATGFYAMGCLNENLARYILESTTKHLVKDDAGLYNLNRTSILYGIQLDDDLNKLFNNSLLGYNKDQNYGIQYCLPEKDVKSYIDKVFGKNMHLETSGYNLLIYLLMNFSTKMMKYSMHLMLETKKKSLYAQLFMRSMMMLCDDNLGNSLKVRLEDTLRRISKAHKKEANKKTDDNQDQKDETDEEVEEEVEEEEVEEEEEEVEEEEEEVEEEVEEEEDEEEKPKSKKKDNSKKK